MGKVFLFDIFVMFNPQKYFDSIDHAANKTLILNFILIKT